MCSSDLKVAVIDQSRIVDKGEIGQVLLNSSVEITRRLLDGNRSARGKQIEEFASTYENPAEVIRWYFSDRDRLAEVEALVVEQNVVDWLLSKAKVTDHEVGFDELMKGLA